MGLGMSLGHFNTTQINLLVNTIQTLIDNFKTRVANDGGTFEAESNLLSILNSVNSSIGLSKVNMLLTPNAFKSGKAYNVIGSTDFAVLRNTDATRVNASNFIEVQGSNIMRIDYRSGTPMILDEIQSTNISNYSEDFTQGIWVKANSSVLANATSSPRGLLEATKILENTNSANHRILKNSITISPGVNYKLSFFAKKAERENILLGLFTGTSFYIVNFNLNTGLIKDNFLSGSTITAGASEISSIAINGFFKCSISFIITSETRISILADVAKDDTTVTGYAGDTTKGIFIWGASLKTDDSSYVPTLAAAVTRNEDVLTVSPPAGTVKITTTFLDDTTEILTSIPATFTLPTGSIKHVVMQKTL